MRPSLDDLAIKQQTDKMSLGHGYCTLYDVHLSPMRDLPIRFLEIGIYKGASLRMWREYFTAADVHGVDIDAKRCEPIEGCTSHCYDMGKKDRLDDFANQHGSWDVVIDDGGHTMSQQQLAFETLWPRLNSGGYYIIEDIHSSFDNGYNDKSVATTLHMCEALRDGKPFHSDWVPGPRLEQFRAEIAEVVLWIRRPEHKGSDDNSATCLIRKR